MKKKRLRRKKSSDSTPPQKFWPKLKGFFKVSVLILVLLGFFFWLRSDFWQIKKVTCELNGRRCDGEIWAKLMSLVGGKNFFLFSSEETIERLKESQPEFFKIEIQKEFPDSLFFKIELRKGAVFLAPSEGGFYLVDKEGFVLEKRDEGASLPIVLIQGQVEEQEGSKIKEDLILKMIEILYEAELRLLRPQSAKLISEKAIEVELTDGLQVLFSAKKETSSQLDSLQFIFERAKIEGDNLKRVDLRFDKPIVLK